MHEAQNRFGEEPRYFEPGYFEKPHFETNQASDPGPRRDSTRTPPDRRPDQRIGSDRSARAYRPGRWLRGSVRRLVDGTDQGSDPVGFARRQRGALSSRWPTSTRRPKRMEFRDQRSRAVSRRQRHPGHAGRRAVQLLLRLVCEQQFESPAGHVQMGNLPHPGTSRLSGIAAASPEPTTVCSDCPWVAARH